MDAPNARTGTHWAFIVMLSLQLMLTSPYVKCNAASRERLLGQCLQSWHKALRVVHSLKDTRGAFNTTRRPFVKEHPTLMLH
jgi:hypothetical protein